MHDASRQEPGDYDLIITRSLRASPDALWLAWTDPALLAQWWCPKPWATEVKAFELRPGGAFHTVMRGPDGTTSDNPGCFLEVLPASRLVFTSMLTGGWRPATPWLAFTASITIEAESTGSVYTARVMHRDEATRAQHEALGFFDGWNIVISQLDDLASTLPTT